MPKHKPELSKFARHFGADDIIDDHNSDEINKNNEFIGYNGTAH